jgi:hypothetical protein
MPESLAQKIVRGHEALKKRKSSFEQSLEDISFYVLPEYENQDEVSDSDDYPKRPVSSVATNASIKLGGNLYSFTYQHGQRNFSLRSLDSDASEEMESWLQSATNAANEALQNSNFSEAYGEMCHLMSTFGTGSMSVEYNPTREELHFRNHPINGNIFVIENSYGVIDGFSREIVYTPSAAIEAYGAGNLPSNIVEAANDPSRIAEQFTFIHQVTRNPKYDSSKPTSKQMPFKSTHVAKSEFEIVKESGFRTNPMVFPRFIKVRNFPYGYGSGHLALPSIRQINRAEDDYIGAIEMEAYPTTFVSDDEAAETAEIAPRAINYVDMTQGPPVQMKIGGNSRTLLERIMQLTGQIKEQFFIDVFMSLSQRYNTGRTATEVNEITEEKLSSIGPMVSRLRSECWSPMIERIIGLMVENGIIPIPPVDDASSFRVVYTSRIDSQLASIRANETLRAANEAAGLLALKGQSPELASVVRLEDAAERLLKDRNLDRDFLISKRERQEIQQAAMAAEDERRQQEMLNKQVAQIDPNRAPQPGSIADQLNDLGPGI